MFLLMATLTGITFLSCNDDDKEERKTIVMEDVSDYIPCLTTNYPQDSVIIINSNEELKEICPDVSVFSIDFHKHSLLLVRSVTHSGISHIFTDLIKENPLKYILSVDIELNDATVAEHWYRFFVTSEKIDSNASVKLKVNYK